MALHFFNLPSEVRRQVYCQLLVSQGDCEIPRGRIYQGRGPHQTVEPALLRVCKQMHDETASILYGQNEFGVYADFYRFKQFLLVAGNDNAALIRKICFCTSHILDLQNGISETVDLSRGPLQGLKKLTIVYSGHSTNLPSYDPSVRHGSVELDLPYVQSAIANLSKFVIDDGGLDDIDPDKEYEIQISIRFAQAGEVKNEAKVSGT